MSAEPLRVGVLYPPGHHDRPEDFETEISRLRAMEPVGGRRLEVIVEPYEDTPSLRTRRSTPGFSRAAGDVTPVTDAQRAAFRRIEVALVLDLPFDTPVIAPNLRWVQSVATGIGQLLSAGLREGGVRLTNAAGTAAPEIAEFVIARLLEHCKRLPEIRAVQRRREWRPLYGRSLNGATIGLVGLGAINSSVAVLGAAFGMRVLACRRSLLPHPAVDEVFLPAQLPEMVSECDFIVAALPETPETVGIFDERFFASVAPGAWFCNVGRGSAVVDEALRSAIASGHLSGAALDVFREEPLPPEDPYWTDGVDVSAHCSSAPSVAIRRAHELFRDNLRRYLADEFLRNEVDLDRRY